MKIGKHINSTQILFGAFFGALMSFVGDSVIGRMGFFAGGYLVYLFFVWSIHVRPGLRHPSDF